MLSIHHLLYSLIVCILIQKVLPQESPDFAEEYIDEDLPESNLPEEPIGSTVKPNTVNDPMAHKKANFSEDRFTKLFGPRRNRPQPSGLLPKFALKPKPTLPSFIKNTQPAVRVQPTQAPTQQRFNQRSATTTQRTTTTRTPSRGNNANNRRNQNNNRSGSQSTPSPGSTTTDSSARRRFGSSNTNRRVINTNSTIPATSRPKRN